jgi:hypothetical protein
MWACRWRECGCAETHMADRHCVRGGGGMSLVSRSHLQVSDAGSGVGFDADVYDGKRTVCSDDAAASPREDPARTPRLDDTNLGWSFSAERHVLVHQPAAPHRGSSLDTSPCVGARVAE